MIKQGQCYKLKDDFRSLYGVPGKHCGFIVTKISLQANMCEVHFFKKELNIAFGVPIKKIESWWIKKYFNKQGG